MICQQNGKSERYTALSLKFSISREDQRFAPRALTVRQPGGEEDATNKDKNRIRTKRDGAAQRDLRTGSGKCEGEPQYKGHDRTEHDHARTEGNAKIGGGNVERIGQVSRPFLTGHHTRQQKRT